MVVRAAGAAAQHEPAVPVVVPVWDLEVEDLVVVVVADGGGKSVMIQEVANEA